MSDVNFIISSRAAFLYKSVFQCFSLVTVGLCNFFGKRNLVQKLIVKCWWNWLQQFLRQYSFPKNYKAKLLEEKCCTKHFRTKKLLITCWWNWLHFTLTFLYKSAFLSFSIKTVWLYNFLCKKISTKGKCKIFVKLTPGVDFINILFKTFTCTYPKSAKRYWPLDWIFTLLGSSCVKAGRKDVGEIDTWLSFHQWNTGSRVLRRMVVDPDKHCLPPCSQFSLWSSPHRR